MNGYGNTDILFLKRDIIEKHVTASGLYLDIVQRCDFADILCMS